MPNKKKLYEIYRKYFEPDKWPKFFRFKDVDEIPRLPSYLTENEFYSQWAREERVYGFPLVEEQHFIKCHANGGGNCYWSATAVLIYGSDKYWPWVKAQHFLWIAQVLENKAHPRYALYRRLLESALAARNYKRQNKVPPLPPLSPSAFNSIGQPDVWTSTDIAPITADLYGINLVIFITKEFDHNILDEYTPVLAKGYPNAPSRFLQFTRQCHFDPLKPMVPRPSEFRYPLITNYTTKDYPHVNKNNKPELHRHPWRTGGQPHGRDGIDEELCPRPVLPLPSEADLAFIIGQQAKERDFSREPGWLPPINVMQVEIANRNVTRIVEGARAVYHSWTEPALLLECTRRHIAPEDDDPTRTVLIDTLLAHDEEVATKLVAEANAKGPPSPNRRTAHRGASGSPRFPPRGDQPPPGPSDSPPPEPKPKPARKENYAGVRKGDLLRLANSRDMKLTPRITAPQLRLLLMAWDERRAAEIVVIEDSDDGGEKEGGAGEADADAKGESSGGVKQDDLKAEEEAEPETEGGQPVSGGKDKGKRRATADEEEEIENDEEEKPSPKRRKKKSKE